MNWEYLLKGERRQAKALFVYRLSVFAFRLSAGYHTFSRGEKNLYF